MGNLVGKMFDWISPQKDVRVVMLGLDAAGKSTILFKMKLGEIVSTIPTIGFNVETVEYKRLKFTVWDVGGQDKLRPLWRHYYDNTDAVIFVVDSNDADRMEEAASELHRLLQDDLLKDAVLLVMANKQDLPNAQTVRDMTDKLKLYKLNSRNWYIQSTSAITGDGIVEGLEWLSNALKAK